MPADATLDLPGETAEVPGVRRNAPHQQPERSAEISAVVAEKAPRPPRRRFMVGQPFALLPLALTGGAYRHVTGGDRRPQRLTRGCWRRMTLFRLLRLAPLLLTACAVEDSHIAREAETRLIGMSEVDLESCLGAPDQHSTFGTTDILTYYATSTSSDSWSVPLIGGFSLNNGAYCHATFQVKNGRVTQILYSGEKNATFAPDAYCAPIMRTCIAHLQQTQPAMANWTRSGSSTRRVTGSS
jgi:hypothetical protein